MNGVGQPLDVGRSTRVVPDGLRRAVTARDRGCAHPGMRPPALVVRNPITSSSGSTVAAPSATWLMLCEVHHRLIHHSGWSVRIRDGRRPEFIAPRWIDPQHGPPAKPLSIGAVGPGPRHRASPVTDPSSGARPAPSRCGAAPAGLGPGFHAHPGFQPEPVAGASSFDPVVAEEGCGACAWTSSARRSRSRRSAPGLQLIWSAQGFGVLVPFRDGTFRVPVTAPATSGPAVEPRRARPWRAGVDGGRTLASGLPPCPMRALTLGDAGA